MTYKGREITENQITVEMVKDIVLNQFLTQHRCWARPYKYITWGCWDREKVFDYSKVLSEYKKFIHRYNSKPPVDLESGIIKIVEHYSSSLLTKELLEYREQKEKSWKEYKQRKKEAELKAKAEEAPVQPVTGVVELPLTKERQGYSEQLEDIRWTAFRMFVFVVKGQKCEQCGSTHYINVHHIKYIPGRKAWEYTCNEVQVLCNECHKKVHNIQESA